MAKAITRVFIFVFFCLAFFNTKSIAKTDISSLDALQQKAKTLYESGQYSKAEQIYKTIIKENRRDGNELKAYQELATLYVQSGNIPAAEETAAVLIKKFSKHNQLAYALYWITERYERLDKFQEAKNNYKQIVENYPNDEWAGWAQLGFLRTEAKSLIASGKYIQAQKTVDKLTAGFAYHSNFSESLYWLAERYQRADRFGETKKLYQQIIEKFPDSTWANMARFSIAKINAVSLLVSQDYVSAHKAVVQLTVDFADNPDLPESLYWIAERYERANKFENAKQLYEQIIKKYPNSPWVDKSRFAIVEMDASSFIALQDYGKAQEALDKLIIDFADNPDLPEMLYWFAARFERADKFSEAKRTYQKIVQNYTDSLWAVKAKLSIERCNIFSLIISEKYVQAHGEINELVTDFADNPDLPETLYWLAERFERAGKFEGAKDIYQQIMGKYSSTQWADKAGFCIARTDMKSVIATQDFEKLKEAIAKLAVNFKASPDLPESIYWLAVELQEKGRYEEAITVYQQIIKDYSETPYAIEAKLDISKTNIISLIASQQDYANVKSSIDKMIKNFSSNLDVVESVCDIGLAYYTQARLADNTKKQKEFYEKAISVWERAIQEFPDSGKTARAYYLAAVCYAQELEQYQKGMGYFQKIVAQWPDYEYAWNAQYLVGVSYERLMGIGAVETSEAMPKIEKAYESVIENYPQSEASVNAMLRLGQINFDKGKFLEAMVYFEILLEREPKWFCSVSDYLKKAYKALGNTDKVSTMNSKIAENCQQ